MAGGIQVKQTYDSTEVFDTVPLRNHAENVLLQKCYKGQLRISVEKFKDLQNLCSKGAILQRLTLLPLFKFNHYFFLYFNNLER